MFGRNFRHMVKNVPNLVPKKRPKSAYGYWIFLAEFVTLEVFYSPVDKSSRKSELRLLTALIYLPPFSNRTQQPTNLLLTIQDFKVFFFKGFSIIA